MIRREQATQLAEALLQQARKARISQANAAAKPVPRYLQNRALRSFEPVEQVAILQAAEAQLRRTPIFLLSLVAWVAVCSASWYFCLGTTQPGFTLPFMVAVAAGVYCICIAFLRSAVHRIAEVLKERS